VPGLMVTQLAGGKETSAAGALTRLIWRARTTWRRDTASSRSAASAWVEADGRVAGVAARGHHRPSPSLSAQLAGSCWSHAWQYQASRSPVTWSRTAVTFGA
jgi:hypothetical protein